MGKVLEYIIRAVDMTGGAVTSAIGRVTGLAKSILGNLANIQAGWQMLSGSIQTVAGELWGAIKEAFKFETLTVQFAVLMGSMTKAQDRMKELAEFAAKTPFAMEETVRASRQLHVFSDGALGAMNSLRMVGDAAAAVGRNIEEVSFWVGRAYSMIKGGQPFGEAAMRLQEMGIITPKVRQEMEALQASGAKNIDVWRVLETRLNAFNGGMEKLAVTGDGLVSTVKDTWTESIRTFGQSFMEVAKKAITYVIEWLGKLNEDGTIKRWADKTLEVVYQVAAALKALYAGGEERTEAWGAIKDVIVGGFTAGGQAAVDHLLEAAPKIGALIGSAAKGMMQLFKQEDYKAAAKGLGLGDKVGFWGGAFGTKASGVTDEEHNAINRKMREIRQARDMKEAGFGDDGKAKELSGTDRMNRGLAVLAAMGKRLQTQVEMSKPELSSGKADPAKKALEDARIIADMADSQKALSKAALAEQKKLVAEKEKAEKKLLHDLHEKRVADLRGEIDMKEKEESKANDRLSKAKDAAQKAWGWYRDPESFKRQLAEEKANAAAEKQYAKDFDKLNDRRDWRTTTRLTDREESVRRVAIAREEKGEAERSLASIDKTLIGMKGDLKVLLTAK